MEVAVFFKRDRGISRAADVHFFATLFGSSHCFGNGRRLRALRLVKHDARPDGHKGDDSHDDERKNAFQGLVEEKVE